MSITDRLDALQRRHPAAGFPIAVIYKYGDDQGGNLAALITYYGFLSLFPLLLLLSTILGIVLVGHPGLQKDVLDSALGQFPAIGRDLSRPRQIGGGTVGLVVGVVGALYGGLGVGQAVQNAMNVAWTVPRNERPNPFAGRLIGLKLLGTVGLAVIVTTALSALGSGAGSLGAVARIAVILVAVALNSLVFALAFRIASARPLSWREVRPGAIAAAIAWQALQTFGAAYVGHITHSDSATGGIFAVVLGLIAFLYLASTLVLLCVEINVVLVDDLYPRALLTPFTDNVDLTSGDEDSYTGQAQAQRAKGFQEVDVAFDAPDRTPEDREPA